MSSDGCIEILNEDWEFIWGEGTLIIHHQVLKDLIRREYNDLLNNPY